MQRAIYSGGEVPWKTVVDITHIIDSLNSAQRQAATHLDSNLLILAGAGSGKTRTIVHRIAYLVITGQAHWHQMLVVTFTNKAANELKYRVKQLLPNQQNAGLWTGTFHSICHKLLRIHAKEIGLDSNFQVLDSSDQQRIVKKIHQQLKLDEQQYPHKKSVAHINQMKEQGKRSKEAYNNSNGYYKALSDVYENYEEYCATNQVLDFTELMLKTCEVLTESDELRWQYQMQFKHILVDEFQDTNVLQYRLLKLLKHDKHHIVVVGDDDQSIYSWRGAKVDHMFKFENDFAPTETIRLEQNYRSTQAILNAANHIIGYNQKRLSKQLWTEANDGEKIKLYAAYNDIDEAQFVCEQIGILKDAGHRLEDCAILYRSNAQSRIFEEKLGQMNIAYRVYGGLRFFERAEIKDLLSYLRLIANQNDNQAFERVINLPPRGIGKVSVDAIRSSAVLNHQSMLQACHDLNLTARAAQSIQNFTSLIEELKQSHSILSDLVQSIIDKTEMVSYLKSQKNSQVESKIENINELVNAARHYDQFPSLTEALNAFLSHAVLDQSIEQEQSSSQVQLMTLHSSKGLEFPAVFLVGVEDDLFPHKMTHHDELQLEEERRLCYVGITRAMQLLYISYAETRRQYGQETYQRPSRFIRELPSEHIEAIRISSKSNTPTQTTYHYTLGQAVYHEKFGEGVVLNYEEDGENSRIQVRFLNAGSKWLLCAYAKLNPA